MNPSRKILFRKKKKTYKNGTKKIPEVRNGSDKVYHKFIHGTILVSRLCLIHIYLDF